MPYQHSCFRYGTWRTERQWIGKNLNETVSSCKKPSLGNKKSTNTTSFPPPAVGVCNQVTWVFGTHYLKVHIGSLINTANSGGRPSPTLHPPLCESDAPSTCSMLVMTMTKFYARTTEEINLQLNTITKCPIWLYFGKYYLHRISKPNIWHCHRKCPTDCFIIS